MLYLREVALQKKYPPLAFRSCHGILSLEKTFGLDRLVAACACASQMRVYGYQDIISILNRDADSDFLPQADDDMDNNVSLPQYKNIRGREYFSKATSKSLKIMETNNKTAPITQEKDRNAVSLDLMDRMKMHGMAAAFRKNLHSTVVEVMTADSFASMLLAREWDYRSEAAIGRLIAQARFRYKAFLEEIDDSINLDRNQIERLASLYFIRQGQNLFITGSSGTGKSYIATALGYQACKEGIRTNYTGESKLMGALKV